MFPKTTTKKHKKCELSQLLTWAVIISVSCN